MMSDNKIYIVNMIRGGHSDFVWVYFCFGYSDLDI